MPWLQFERLQIIVLLSVGTAGLLAGGALRLAAYDRERVVAGVLVRTPGMMLAARLAGAWLGWSWMSDH